MQSTAQSIRRLQRLLDGETVEGLRLGDPGLHRDFVTWKLSELRQEQRDRRDRIATRRQNKRTIFSPQSIPADGDKVEVMVGWEGRPEAGALSCEVLERWSNGGAKIVRWAAGNPQRVVYSHSRRCYVFLNDPK